MAFSIFGSKKKNSIDDNFERVQEQLDDLERTDDPRNIEKYILDSCEQIVRMTKDIESGRRESRAVSEYLDDIKRIREADDETGRKLKVTAGHINDLLKSRESFRNTPKRLNKEEFRMIDEEREELPGIIERMKENEVYEGRVKKDMYSLEGEKARLEMRRDRLNAEIRLVRNLSIVSLVLFTVLILLSFVINKSTGAGSSVFFSLALFIGALAAAGLYFSGSRLGRNKQSVIRSLNSCISLLNVTRMKYANVKSAVDYNITRYKIESASQLEYMYGLYKSMVEDTETYRKNNLELSIEEDRFKDLLNQLGLNDAAMWTEHIEAFLDDDELKKTEESLTEKLERLKSAISVTRETVKSERDDIDRLMKENDYYVSEVLEIIHSVDRICGLKRNNAYSRKEKK